MKKNSKRNLEKFTKRNKHKRRSKEAMRSELLRQVASTGVSFEGAKLRSRVNTGRPSAREGRAELSVLARGVFSGTRSGFGFVSTEGEGEDIFIPPEKCGGAIDGDFVSVAFRKYTDREGKERTEGRVLEIIEYGRRTVIGEVTFTSAVRHGKRARIYRLIPDDSGVSVRPVIRDIGGAKPSEKVEAMLVREEGQIFCDVIRVFGEQESPDANYAAILAESGIPLEFTPEELASAERAAREELTPEGRVDRRGEIIFTVDGEGAKDLDDAVSLRRLPGGGYRLGVHIADVSHYVREKTALDRAAMARGTSVYFIDKVVPMLPPALSNGACSLNADEDKYALSAIIDLDAVGEIVSSKIERSIIRSAVRGVYSEVNAIFEGSAAPDIRAKYKRVLPTLEKMKELYLILKDKSERRGALNLEVAESEIVFDEDGKMTEIRRRERADAEKMIEQFMLAANEAVAVYLTERGIPCVYRIHEQPPEDKLGAFVAYAHSLGFDATEITKRKEVTPRELSALLASAEEKGLLAPVSYTLLRSMAKARYSDKLTPHFGLALDTYCHFTSPIRRLSDLATHRIINRVLFDGKKKENYISYATRAAAAATEGELRAISAERRIEDLYKVMYMSGFIGDVFEVTVTSVTSFGLFCELSNTCEGLLPADELGYNAVFDEKTLTLRRGSECFRLGDRLFVKLEEADIVRGKLRFSPVPIERLGVWPFDVVHSWGDKI